MSLFIKEQVVEECDATEASFVFCWRAYKKINSTQNRIETIFDTQIILVCIKKLTLTLRMQEMKRYILTLTMLIITATVCAQNIFWLQGNWR